ncbi:glucosylceramide transporter ABCA12 [Plectropomus leopardus]|uniref:glucosylceramide transporter ABCA12 n=1 Tax=Plectropomus leopardus TaxID=160734 RepID=UPI001C4CAA0F|nr:glucosylceramide transporter ABCA12 [Plectropomus leopardus]
MAFFRQLKLLLWKNGLAIIRQPLWSLTLIIWPLIIFIIIAVTRDQFPPVLKDTCYARARNLPSTGFFPFLQTLMCNTDSNCHNKSHLVSSAASRSPKRTSRAARSSHPLATLIKGAEFFNLSKDSRDDPAALIEALNKFVGSSYQGSSYNATLMNTMNTTLLGDEETLNEMLESVNLLKRAICSMTLPMMNTTSPDALSYAVVSFCKSNNTLFEVSLNAFNQILKDLLLTKPNETMTVAGTAVLLFDYLQNQTSLWESLLAIPQLFTSGSVDQALTTAEDLLTNIQSAMHVIQTNFPEASDSLSAVYPVFAGGINVIHYAQNWPGKAVSISLGAVVTLQNDSLIEMVKPVLQGVEIPLDKAIGLTLDRNMVHMYVCNKSSNPLWLTAACSTGTVDMLLGWIDPEEVAKQVLLAWSKHVAPHDVSFAKGLLYSLMGGSFPGGKGGSNTMTSMDTQPQNIEEELFLEAGKVVMEIIKIVPEVDMVAQIVLRSGFQCMKSAILALDAVEEIMGSVLKDADQLQMNYLTLLTNQSEASVWTGRVMDSAMEVIMKILSNAPVTCEDVLGPFEWLLTTESVTIEVWRSAVCQDIAPLEQALQMGRLSFVQKAQEVYNTITDQKDYNVTLPMILSEWHKLSNNSLQLAVLLDRVATELSGAYWMNWMPDDSNHSVTETLQKSVFFSMVNLGERIEKSQLWPEVKDSFNALYWILNYSPGVTTQPANCSVNIYNQDLDCDTGLNWPQFVQAMTRALMSPSQDVLVKSLKGAVNLLQHVYGDIFQQMIGSYLKQEINGGDALSAYLINLMQNLADFVNMISRLPDQNIADPNVMLPHISNMLQSVGLGPLLPLLVSEGPVNVSTVIDVASKVGRLNQHIFTFNETDPTLPELERLIVQFLSLEGNLTMSLSHIMGHTLLTYSNYFYPDDVARLREAIRPFTNQTSAGSVEAILHAMELLKEVMDSPNGDPADIIFACLRQLQEFIISLYRLRRIQHIQLPGGQLSPAQVTDLHLLSKDFLSLLTPEALQNLVQAGPDAALSFIAQKFIAFLPAEVQEEAAHFLQDFNALLNQVNKCAAGENCLAGISELFTFLDQILDKVLSANGDVTIKIAATNSTLLGQEYEEIASLFFPLLLPSNDAANVETFKQALHFARLIMAKPNVTVSDVMNALRQSNLTIEELNNITALAGAANVNDLVVNIIQIIDARECFKPQRSQMVTAQCVMGLIDGVSSFLTHIPALRNEAAIISLIPIIVNNTISDVLQVNFSSNPNIALAHTLNSTLANIKMTLQMNQLDTPEIMNEIKVVEGLIQLVTNMEPFNNLNPNLLADPIQAQKVYLEIVEWYLKKLENITSASSVSELLQPFYFITQMQVTLQLAQGDFSLFVSKQVEFLMNNLRYPIDGTGVSKIGQTTVEILRHQYELIKVNLEAQNKLFGNLLFNTSTLHEYERQIKLYLDIIEKWLKQPNVQSVLSSMLQWGNQSINVSTPVKDIQELMETMVNFLSDDQLAYLSIIHNITMPLSKALMVAEQPGGLQSPHFSGAILEGVQSAMQILSIFMTPPLSVQQNILAIVQDSLSLIVQPDMSFASSRNVSLLILKRAKSIIQETVPEMFAEYLLAGLKIATTYFESVSASGGPDSLNQLILDEMQTVQSLLPPNSPVQAYISVLINITRFILESGQGNMSLWASFESPSEENLPFIFGQMGKLLNIIWPLFMGGPDSQTIAPSLEGFAYLATVLEQLMTGEADEDTWNKLEKILEALLSTLKGTEIWDSVPSVIPAFEKIVGSTVNSIQAQNVLILSLQTPVVILMREFAHSVNSSHFNLTEVSKRMQRAIEHTLQAAEQANGTLECSEVLKAWEPIREAAGLSHATMAMWCNINLKPVFEAYSAAGNVYAHMNMSHMGVGPMTVSATAARIVRSIQSLYQVNINSTLVTAQLIEAFFSQLSELAGQPLSPEAQLHWYNQLQDMQMQNSLSYFKMLADELVSVAPFLKHYTEALEKALSHILDNYHLIQDSSVSHELFREAAMIFLSSANIMSDDMTFSGGPQEASITSMIKEALKLVIDMKIFGDAPMVYQALEQFLASNSSSLIVQKVAEMSEWFASTEVSGLDAASIYDMMQEAVKLMMDMKMFGDAPMVYHALEKYLISNESGVIVQEVVEMLAWLVSTEASGLDLLTQALPKIWDILSRLLSVLTEMSMDMPANMELLEDIPENIIEMLTQLVNSSGPLISMDNPPSMFRQETIGGNHTMRVRSRREAPLMLARTPMDDFIDLLYIDYPAMFKAISVPVTTAEIMETVHVFFANRDLNVVMKGATRGMPWGLEASREETIDATLGVLSFLTLPGTFQMSSMNLLTNAVSMLPDDFPFSSMLKNIARMLATESQENLMLMQETIETAAELFQISPTDPRFIEQLSHLESKVCKVEGTETVRLLMSSLSIGPGQLCHTYLPSLKTLVEGLLMDTSSLTDAIFQAVIGDPKTYNVQSDWSSVLSQGLGFNTSSLSSLNINVTSPGVVTVGEMLRDKTAFIMDVQQHMDFDPVALHLLMETTLPNNNLEILSWLFNLRHCGSTAALEMKETDVAILKTFCSLSVEQWYSFSLLMARHLNMEKLIYRVVLSEEIQSLVGIMIQMAKVLTNMMDTILPAIDQLHNYMDSIQNLNLASEQEFDQMAKGRKAQMSSKATFVTLSRALCSKGIVALLGISKLPAMPDSDSYFPDDHRQEMIERFKIPENASPFCMNMYLDMVNTTGGAIAWAFLKPMLMGEILYTPDTPVTRAIMKKANDTLQVFADLRKHSEDWIDSSNYIIKSAELLSHTLPMLQNSLGNSFVENFIEMQTDINVGRMKETLSNFSNMTVMLEKNKHIMNQITTLSTLMVNLSSCIKFDRYRGYNSADQLNSAAEDLAKNRNLYASVIFKLPKDEDSSRKRRDSFSSSTSSLPPNVSYTIRMHMDNVMRTDKVRDPIYVKDNHIWSQQALRYSRGFIYLQENIERAIIETQTGQRVTELAVQLQPFSYPCSYRDEYLEAIAFVFPLMLMIAWVLFVADFVKKLVHERELRLHEYMKMMGVNPASHFFAWFLECAFYLVVTIFILTLVLKYGRILPQSDGFLLFLYLCDYGLSILAFSYLVSSFFDQTYIAALSGSLLYILCFFPFIVVMAVETNLTFSQKSALGLFSPTCFSYASQYVSRYEAQGEGIQWSNSYTSPIAGDTASFGWLCWLMLIDSVLYFVIGGYIRMVFPGKYGIPAPWYFPFKASFWSDLCCCVKSKSKVGRGLLFSNIMQKNQPVFSDDKGKDQSTLSSQAGEDFSELPVGVALHGLSKIYGDQVAIQNLNVSFYEGHVTSLLGHNGAGKTTTMSLLTGLFAPSSGSIEVYGKDMQTNTDDVRRELGVCMQYDVLFDHMTAKEHLLLYGQIKAPQWSRKELHEQVNTILEETDMYAHRHKRVGTLSGGMRRKLSISIAFIGGSRLVVLDEPTTGVDPCSRRNIWDIVIQNKQHRTVIMSTHHLDEAEVLSDRIAFLERGGLKCCGSPFHLKDKLGQGYKLTLTKKMQNLESEPIDNAEMKAFIQAHVPDARLKEAQGGDLVYSLPPFTSSNASSYRSLLTALDSNLDALQLGGYGISDTTLEEVFLQLTHGNTEAGAEDTPLSISETISETDSIDSFSSDSCGSIPNFGDKIKLTSLSMVRGMALAWQQMAAIMIKRFHHSRRDWKGLISQILLPVLFMVAAMGLSSIKNDLQHYPELELSPALYKFGPSYSFFSNQNPNSTHLVDTMMSFPGIDNTCIDRSNNPVCTRSTSKWSSRGNSSKPFSVCKCTHQEQICDGKNFQPPHKQIPSSQIMYNVTGIDLDDYLIATANDFIRNRYGGFSFGMPLPPDLLMDVTAVPKNRTLAKVWFNPEGHHTMPAYLNSINNIILRSNLPADKDPRKYAISVSSHPYFGRADNEESIVQGMLQILVAMCVLTGYSITTASFAIYEVSEHHSGSKRLQHISGISEPFYWAVNFFYDMGMYLIPVTLTVGVIAAFQVPAFTDRQNLGAVTLLLVLFGFSTFPWMYLLAGVFKDAEMAFIAYVCINLFISVNTIMSTSVLYFISQITVIKQEFVQKVFEQLSHAFLIFPQFNFGGGLIKLARTNIEVQLLSGYGIDAYKNPYSTEALGWMFISSFIQGVVFFTLRLLLNRFLIRKVRNLIWSKKKVPQLTCEDEDEDVAAEHLRVSSGAASMDILQVNQLSKVYQHLKKKIHAVKKISVGIPAGECFGLLGVNGAGKTTTFKMLTGDVSPTDGTAQIRDWDGRLVDIMECRNQGINIGYCPQVDALDSLLTGEEHLYFYARIRGISKREIDRVVNYLLKKLELRYHRNIITDGYSCGTRRKLSTALALIGHPQILLLDEPSSGMDPRTKRHLWKIISEEVKGKCAVVLTSHSMEECEALCSRLAIMVKGQFRCLGSLQHIKNRFGSGFTVKMYLAKASCDAEAITGFMQRRFPSTYLKDQHSSMVEYHVPIAPGGVADIFDQLESNKNALQIKHFSVSQTTLDEVFINFAMGNIGMEPVALNCEDECDGLDSIKAVET